MRKLIGMNIDLDRLEDHLMLQEKKLLAKNMVASALAVQAVRYSITTAYEDTRVFGPKPKKKKRP